MLSQPYRFALSAILVFSALALAPACKEEVIHVTPAPQPEEDAQAPGTPDGGPAQGDGATPDAAAPAPYDAVEKKVTSGGKSRSYTLALPKGMDGAKSYPLVVVLHADGGTGAGLQKVWGYESYTNKEVIAAYPRGIDGSWDLEYRATSVPGTSLPNADVDFVADMIDDIAASQPIDKKRVFAVGWSKGAFFAHVLACRRPDLFAGMAANAGDVPNYVADMYGPPAAKAYPGSDNPEGPDVLYYVQCTEGQTPVPAFIVQGALDSVGSGPHSFEYWSIVNGCGAQSAATTPSPCVARSRCPASSPVVYCEIPGMGHAIWKDLATASWGFFKGLP